jgi:hypothetical protein
MQYDFRDKTLSGALRKSLAQQPSRLQRKSSATVSSEYGRYNYEVISAFVKEGYSYTISWEAQKSSGDGGAYGIYIRSYDGHGEYRGSFRTSGSWNFTARKTGEVKFSIGVSRSFRSVLYDYSVDISID